MTCLPQPEGKVPCSALGPN